MYLIELAELVEFNIFEKQVRGIATLSKITSDSHAHKNTSAMMTCELQKSYGTRIVSHYIWQTNSCRVCYRCG